MWTNSVSGIWKREKKNFQTVARCLLPIKDDRYATTTKMKTKWEKQMDRLLRHANILKKQHELKWNWTWDYVARCISLPATRCVNRSQANSAERNGWLQVTVSIVRSHRSKGENHNCWRFCFCLTFKYLYQATGHVYSTSIHWFITSCSSHCHKWLHHSSRCLKTITP